MSCARRRLLWLGKVYAVVEGLERGRCEIAESAGPPSLVGTRLRPERVGKRSPLPHTAQHR